jgi:uncharacterized membrane protein
MFALKWLLMVAGVAMFGTAAGVVAYDVYLARGSPGRTKRRGRAVPSGGRWPRNFPPGGVRRCSWR